MKKGNEILKLKLNEFCFLNLSIIVLIERLIRNSLKIFVDKTYCDNLYDIENEHFLQ